MRINNDCQCEGCQSACKYNPGWFLPGEVERAAEFLGITIQEFLNRYLGVNWWEADSRTDTDIFVLAPAVVTMEAGREYPGDPRGQCVFFEDGLCKIHSVKPFECAEYDHTQSREAAADRHWLIAQAWLEHQTDVTVLLGREAQTTRFTGGLFAMLGL